MIALLYIATLCFVAVAILAGPCHLLLRRTRLGSHVVELSLLLFPQFLVLAGSELGYVHALKYRTHWIVLGAALGAVTTAVVLFRERALLRERIRRNGARLAIAMGLSLVASLLVVPRQVAENKLGYLEFMNGEFVNYAQSATFSLGHQHSEVPVRFARDLQRQRDGVDFINVTVAYFSRNEPIDIVQITSAFFRFIYCTLCISIVLALCAKDRLGRLTGILISIALVFYSLDIYQFQISFMASNAAIGAFMLLVLLVTWRDALPLPHFLALFVPGNLYLLISYPEVMPFLKLVEFAMIAESLCRGRGSGILGRIALGNAAVVLANPWLAFAKIRFVSNVSQAVAGGNFLGSPVDSTTTYIRRLLGLEYNYVSSSAVVSPLIGAVLFLVAGFAAIWVLAALARRVDTRIVWLVPAGLAWFHLQPLIDPASGGYKVFYGALKFGLLWIWIVPVALAAASAGVRSRFGAIAVAVTAGLFAAGNAVVVSRAIARQLEITAFYSRETTAAVLREAAAQGLPVAILTERPLPTWYWFQRLDAAGLAPVAVTPEQLSWIHRGADIPFVDPLAAHPEGEVMVAIQPERLVWFSNYDVIDVEESTASFNSANGGSRIFSPVQTLFSAPHVSVKKVSLHTKEPRPTP